MLIHSAWAGAILSPFTLSATSPGASIRTRSGASGQNRWSAVRALSSWLGLSSKNQPRSRAYVSNDRKTWNLDQDATFKIGHEMLCRLRGNHQPLSVLVFDISDLPELECVFGVQAAKEIITQTAATLQRLAARRGLAVQTGPTVFTVLLPGIGRDAALAVIGATLGRPCCIELDAGGHEIVLVPDFLVKTVFWDAASLREIYESLCRDMAQTRLREERRKKYLARERESHARPMKLQATTASPRKIPQGGYPEGPATMPVPMATRQQGY
jgi:GGDEF domain-containing protein